MSTLAEAQRAFLRAIFTEEDAGAIGIYRRNVLANQAAALAAAYPVVRRLVGEAFFDEAARRHALAHPSRCGDLNAYGATFAEFIAAYPHAASLPYLPDVARLEWAVHRAAFAADAPPFDFAALAASDAQGLRLRLSPSAALVASPHPIVSLWDANQPGRDGVPARSEGAEHAAVWRNAQGVQCEAIGEGAWAVLAALQEGATLARASAGHEALLPDALPGWVASGLVAGVA